MTDPEGGIYSTQDADSEGEEGKFYVWTKTEIEKILGPEAAWFCDYYDITEHGNFEGKNIPNLGDHSDKVRTRINLRDDDFIAKLDEFKSRLLAERKKRIAPSTDDKILASWNGLAVSAYAQAYQITGNESYLQSGSRAADFILGHLIDGDALYHSYRNGARLKTELLEDYAYFVAGLIDLYQASFDEKYVEKAGMLSRRAVDIFLHNGAFYLSPADETDLIFRPRDLTDGATPSPASVMILNLLRLGAITGDTWYTETGRSALKSMSGLASQMPQGSASLIIAGYFDYAEPVEIVVTGQPGENLADFKKQVFSRFIPNKVVVGNLNGKKSDLPLLEGRQDSNELTWYFCVNRNCRLPVTRMDQLATELDWVMERKK
jgi:uncharacterized protein YyaL (SSP411 family)